MLKKPLFWIIFFAIIVRLSLVFLDFSFDVNNHITWGKDLFLRGFWNFYGLRSTNGFEVDYPNYPPVPLYFFYLLYPLQPFVFKILWWLNLKFPVFPSKLVLFAESRLFIASFFKIPGILADFGIAWLIYKIAKKMFPRSRQALMAISFFLFNPVFIYVSSFWGQIDTVLIFFVLFAFYELFFKERYYKSILLFTLALLTKPTVIIFLPVYALFFIRKFKVGNLLKAISIGLVVSWFLFLPFLGKIGFLEPFIIYYKDVLIAQTMSSATNGAYNFWAVATGIKSPPAATRIVSFINFEMCGYLIAAVFVFWTVIVYWKKKDKGIMLFYPIFLSAMACVLFLVKMHERYMIFPTFFLLLLSLKDKKFWKWYLILSAVAFLNLYNSWPVPFIEILFNILAIPIVYKSLSLINIFVFFFLFKSYIMKYRGERR